MTKIVIVEDELIAAEYLKEILVANQFDIIDIIDNGKEAISRISELNPDLVLMDIMLKDSVSGSEVALHLKHHAPKIAVIFLTAYANDEMVEYAMEANTFGYLMKQYNEQEIINTLKVVCARIKENSTQLKSLETTLKIDRELTYDFKHKKLIKNGIELSLGKNALNFLEILCKNSNTSVSNEQISIHVWGEIKNDVTIRTQIHRIKTKIGANVIHNINGIGYKIESIN
jgi:DNA-binding response OmpR family regulator